MVRRQSSSLSPSSSPCLSSGSYYRRLFERTFEGFDCKINGQALGAAFQHILGGSDGRAHTQGVSESGQSLRDAAGSLEETVLPLLR